MTTGGLEIKAIFGWSLSGARHTEWDVICTWDARCVWWRSCYRRMVTVPVDTMTELSLISASSEEMIITVLAISRCIVGDWQIQNSIVMLSSWWWYPNDKHGSTSIIYKCPLFKQVTGLFLVIYPLQHSIISSYSLSVLTFRNSSKPETFTNSQLQSCIPHTVFMHISSIHWNS